MTIRSITILFALLTGTICASCSREDTVAPPVREKRGGRAIETTPQNPFVATPQGNHTWTILTKTDLLDEESNPYDLQGIWEPSESEVVCAIHDVRPYLEKLKKAADIRKVSAETSQGRIGEILTNWDTYLCQAVGHVKDGKKLIHLNFFRLEEDESPTGWRKHYYDACDGGAWFWRIEYDCNAKTFSDFETNGDA